MSIPAIEVRGLAKSYGPRHVLRDVDLCIAPGQVVALLGPSGAGKTTLFRCITGLVPADAGSVWLFGRELTTLRGRPLATARRDIGIIYQQFNLVQRLTAIENVLIGYLDKLASWRVLTRTYAAADIARAEQHLASVGLAGHAWQRADRLSGGQQQRVAIARTLMQESKVILADEPVSSLDPETSMQILKLLRGLAKDRGITLLCSLHQPHYVTAVADRALRFSDGTIGPAANVMEHSERATLPANGWDQNPHVQEINHA